jgi:hypothetical protein
MRRYKQADWRTAVTCSAHVLQNVRNCARNRRGSGGKGDREKVGN